MIAFYLCLHQYFMSNMRGKSKKNRIAGTLYLDAVCTRHVQISTVYTIVRCVYLGQLGSD